ncbi:hypothetical protein LCGC14_3041580 [marine sediment metagenome]|uniref:Uncharacterized protein n=1 Tax=marine sediment metagenome TaxID=412755 RepID=A0A0F8XCN1_9ZZZZ
MTDTTPPSIDRGACSSYRNYQDDVRPQYNSLSFSVNGRSSSSRTLVASGDPCWPQIAALCGPLTQGTTPRWIAPTTKSCGGRSKAKAVHFDVVPRERKAAPDGLDRRVGGHRERIAEGPRHHTLYPSGWEPLFSWGDGGFLCLRCSVG